MSLSNSSLSLRNILYIDAATCAAFGVLLAAASGIAGGIMQLPPALLFYAGLGLLPVAVFMALVARREPIHPAAAWVIIAGNVLWVVGSLLLLAAGWVAPNFLGAAFIVVQALVVAGFAWLEHAALNHAQWRTA